MNIQINAFEMVIYTAIDSSLTLFELIESFSDLILIEESKFRKWG